MSKIVKSSVEHILPTGYFKINGVNYHGENKNYELLEKMAFPMSQDNLAEFSTEEKKKGNFYAIGLPQFLAIVKTGIASGNNTLLNYVHWGLKMSPHFLSKAIFSPIDSENKVLHEYGTPEQYSNLGNLFGDNDWIKKISNKSALELITEIRGAPKLNHLSEDLTGNSMYLWRLDSKPLKKIEHVVGLKAKEFTFILSTIEGLQCVNPSFLVRELK